MPPRPRERRTDGREYGEHGSHASLLSARRLDGRASERNFSADPSFVVPQNLDGVGDLLIGRLDSDEVRLIPGRVLAPARFPLERLGDAAPRPRHRKRAVTSCWRL